MHSSLPEVLTGDGVVLRPWRLDEHKELAAAAQDIGANRTLTDMFPDPYTVEDAKQWLRGNAAKPPCDGAYAIVVDSQPVGTISALRGSDVRRLSAEVGYWLARPLWGKGIVTAALRLMSDALFAHTDLLRLYAPVYSSNPPSMRVLEKAHYVREGVLRQAIVKNGVLMDCVLYARTRPSTLPYEPTE